jgi:hypothetical protein
MTLTLLSPSSAARQRASPQRGEVLHSLDAGRRLRIAADDTSWLWAIIVTSN